MMEHDGQSESERMKQEKMRGKSMTTQSVVYYKKSKYEAGLHKSNSPLLSEADGKTEGHPESKFSLANNSTH